MNADDDGADLRRSALDVCVELTALAMPATVPDFIAAGHARLAHACGARGGHVAIGVRSHPAVGDPLFGWRISVLYELGVHNPRAAQSLEQVLRRAEYVHDPVIQSVARDAGRHRVYHDPDPRLRPERSGTYDEHFWSIRQLVDRLKLVHTVSATVEVHMAVDRGQGSPPFNRRDAVFLEEVVQRLGPWARRVALLHGQLETHTPLSPREREMTCALLGHEPLKRIADQLEVSEARAREIVRAVYRKLRVGTRAELAALWGGEQKRPAEQPVGIYHGPRPGSGASPARSRARRRKKGSPR